MYINWFHHFVPQIFGYLAFIVNPYFVYLIFTEKVNLGNYRFLFSYFALFNIFHSLMDIFVPIVAYIVAVPNLETRKYIQNDFIEIYNADSLTLNFFALMYREATLEVLIKSYFGVVAGTFVSVASISIFMTFGILIMKLLKEKRLTLSEKTARLQKELLRALIVQTAIPICLSFAPCMLSWYTPMFNLKLGKWLNYTGAVALAAFPFIDPVALTKFSFLA
ncbi:hypothetical protein B9Z55_017232 [Caenorhabditis nigoni]|uniref:7TM GPCR serpentine receptor class x (Srx) domain-containing protein n=1 Tax=Caenorhabditis nigoni TaxID=1611254 RepID=A0A2G5T8Q8_9PELO|nr:hypothetical protein B9Z55_017232 [Caenorhabditis nigoni]